MWTPKLGLGFMFYCLLHQFEKRKSIDLKNKTKQNKKNKAAKSTTQWTKSFPWHIKNWYIKNHHWCLLFFVKGINCFLDRWESSAEGETIKVCNPCERKGKRGIQRYAKNICKNMSKSKTATQSPHDWGQHGKWREGNEKKDDRWTEIFYLLKESCAMK